MKKVDVNIIGSGVAGMAAAGTLAHQGYSVRILDNQMTAGGRARMEEVNGFHFDLGPSWYWMPEVFENYFFSVGSSVEEHYELQRLDPSYQVFFGKDRAVSIPADYREIRSLFESFEEGAAAQLDQYMEEAEYKYKVGMEEFVWKPGKSLMEFMDRRVFASLTKLDLLSSLKGHVEKFFRDERIREIMKFPVLFLGAAPGDSPALYSLMNYADLKLGTWYPRGGMVQISRGMERVARDLGVEFVMEAEVMRIEVEDSRVSGLKTSDGNFYPAAALIAAGDYQYADQKLLPKKYRQYSPSYWEKRKMAPSSLLFYLGVEGEIPGLEHHNLFFDEDFEGHAEQIYGEKAWPERPLFYACCPSKTDDRVAPAGSENLFLLVPLAPGLADHSVQRERLFEFMMDKIQQYTGRDIRGRVVYKKSFAMRDFEETYHSFKGNAYGLANTLRQTAVLKPSMHHKTLKNMLFAGQLTVPGPGLPPSIISGQLAARELSRQFFHQKIS